MERHRLWRALVIGLVIVAMIKIFTSRGTVRINPKGEDPETERFWRQGSSEPDNWDTPEDPSEAEEKNNQKAEEEIEKKIDEEIDKIVKETDKKIAKETDKKIEKETDKKIAKETDKKIEKETDKKIAKEIDKTIEKETNKKTEERIAKKESKPEPEEEEVIEIKRVPDRPSAGPLQLVHLDLKGAAPKVSYLKQIFPLFSSLGATGILIEYEDMFPYEGELQILRSPNAYSPEEIEEIQNFANHSNLEVVPLVQVFGHLEFVLKHEKYLHLREVDQYPNSLSPKAPGSLELVTRMLKQVLKRHPNIRWFHIGADEVYELGQSENSKAWLEMNNGDVGALYLNHVSAICSAVTEMRPGIGMLFWEDMLRKMSVETIQASGLPAIAFPMIWSYSPQMDVKEIGNLVEKYQTSGFTGVWFASAFKGASEVDQRWPPLKHYMGNHLAWLKMLDFMPMFPNIKFQGIALTGWQRYEHFIRLCELLPVAIPSLAVCLQTLKHRAFNEEAKNEVEHILGCKIQLDSSNCEGTGAFAGTEVYHMVQKIHNELQNTVDEFMRDHFLRGSLSSYNRKYNFANPRNLAYFKDRMKKTLEEWESFIESFQKEMEVVFYPDTVEEWLEENVNEQMNKLRGLVTDAERIFSLKGRPKSLTVR